MLVGDTEVTKVYNNIPLIPMLLIDNSHQMWHFLSLSDDTVIFYFLNGIVR